LITGGFIVLQRREKRVQRREKRGQRSEKRWQRRVETSPTPE